MRGWLKELLVLPGYMLVGALAFWIPDILIHDRLADSATPGRMVLLLGVALPTSVLLLYIIVRAIAPSLAKARPLAGIFLAGIWCLCPIIMFAAALMADMPGLLEPGAVFWTVFIIIVSPPYTMTISFQDSSILGLLFISAVLGILTATREQMAWQRYTSLIPWRQ